MLLTAAGVFYQGVVKTRDVGSKVAVEAIAARAILNRMADELRHAVALVPGDGRGFSGTKESITIVRTRLPENYAFDEYGEHDDLPPAQMDLIRVTYHLYWDEEGRVDETTGIRICYGVWRTEQKTFDPNPRFVMAADADEGPQEGEELDVPKPENELYAQEIKYLRFEYYDGVKWRDRWNVAAEGGTGGADEGGGGGAEGGMAGFGGDRTCVLPQAVKITIGRVPVPPEEDEDKTQDEEEERDRLIYHPDRFTTVVYLTQADQSLLSSRRKGSVADREQMGEQTSGGR
jgi:hypothetical protein